MIQPRTLGGFAVFPTGSTLLREIADPLVRAEIIRRCRLALDELEAGLVHARDVTATELCQVRGMDLHQVARLFRASNRREVLQAQPDAAIIFEAIVRTQVRRHAARARRERARRAA